MGLFSKSEKQIEHERKAAREDKLLESLVLFPGSVEEYATFRGYSVEVVDTERLDKGVFYDGYSDRSLIASLIDKKGVEALVNVSFKSHGGQYSTAAYTYGLLVRRKH
ncbi:MAG: hypothetical protein U1B79_01040 [Candidatus Pacearchaeota archaeon]|nr:hypothetical protein [Nanoarchaeota archaeon]MDZ4226676.1 hypothetical protein [Candidatus Pacearchaeota archaeon]